jgi:predicted rRNA methylase YqxC with S4 and FtsJ domains
MSNTYTWKITTLESFADINGLENAVSRVYWKLLGTDEVNTVEVNGTVDLDIPNSEGFIAYAELTEAQVVEWTKAKLGSKLENEYYQYLDQKLAESAKPASTVTPMPWMPSE